MTLAPGDVLLLGARPPAPRVRAGQRVAIEIDGLGRLENHSSPRAGSHEARARRLRRALHAHEPRSWPTARSGVRLADGRVLAENEVVWLPPFEAGTIIALGLNYADHAQGAGLQGAGGAAGVPQGPGHAARPPRPRRAGPPTSTFMHYECELAVVIGAAPRERARAPTRWQHVAGYTSPTTTRSATTSRTGTGRTCASRTATARTVLGPWLVDAADVADAAATSRCARSSTAS